MTDERMADLLQEADDALVAYLAWVYDESVFMPDLDPRWPRLLAAARVWKANLIPNTSSSIYGPTRMLLEAIEAFEKDTSTA